MRLRLSICVVGVVLASVIPLRVFAEPYGPGMQNGYMIQDDSAGVDQAVQGQRDPAAQGNAQGSQQAAPAEAQDQGESCPAVAEVANLTCNTMSIAGMDPEQGAMVEMLLTQAAGMVQQIKGAGDNQSAQCKNQMDLSKILGLISAAKAAGCASTMNKCVTACENRLNYLKSLPVDQQKPFEAEIKKELPKQIADCKSYKSNAMLMMMQTMQLGQNFLQNKQCANTTAVATPVPSSPVPWATPGPVELPKTGDCTDPKVAQSSLYCICQSDPKNALCTGGKAPDGWNVGGSGVTPGGTTSVPRPYGDSTKSKGAPIDQSKIEGKPSNGTDSPHGGGGGGGLGGGSGGGAGGGEEGGGGAPSNVDKNVITGMSGGGGGGLGGGGGGGAGRGAGGGSGGGLMDKFNLKKFLPNKKDFKNRGLAGMTIPSTDGITGPMGPSIWEKVSNQYQLQKPRLLPEK